MKALGAFTLGEGMKVEAGVHGQGEGKGEVPVDITLQSVLLLPLEETNLPGDRGGWYWSLKENLLLLSDAIFFVKFHLVCLWWELRLEEAREYCWWDARLYH